RPPPTTIKGTLRAQGRSRPEKNFSVPLMVGIKKIFLLVKKKFFRGVWGRKPQKLEKIRFFHRKILIFRRRILIFRRKSSFFFIGKVLRKHQNLMKKIHFFQVAFPPFEIYLRKNEKKVTLLRA